ncbi:biotin transporter BioY [Bacillus marinisedimentorum]|uniref:biotin transporter BioY n=1 Tax=Bacillus marinisedimentorum TaxID=1821260 RepID=UPI0008731376|nr:biotin transporter BioY [Bacillus marinisedimentorum]
MSTYRNGLRFTPIEITLVGMFAALMAVGANITSWAPFLQVAGIPLTMQPFFAVLAGLLLGSRLGAVAMAVYIAIGLAGAPVFAKFSTGLTVLYGPTGGFLLSFIAVAYAAGKIIEKADGEPGLPHFFAAAFTGIFLNYFLGTNYMYAAVNTWIGAEISYAQAWAGMMLFAVKDAAFTAVAAMVAPRLYRVISRSHALTRARSNDVA